MPKKERVDGLCQSCWFPVPALDHRAWWFALLQNQTRKPRGCCRWRRKGSPKSFHQGQVRPSCPSWPEVWTDPCWEGLAPNEAASASFTAIGDRPLLSLAPLHQDQAEKIQLLGRDVQYGQPHPLKARENILGKLPPPPGHAACRALRTLSPAKRRSAPGSLQEQLPTAVHASQDVSSPRPGGSSAWMCLMHLPPRHAGACKAETVPCPVPASFPRQFAM